MHENKAYRLAVFDMDGTLLDTLNDLAIALNWALTQNGYPSRSLAEVRQFVGNGIMKLVERGVPPQTDAAAAMRVFDAFNAFYQQHCADHTKPYEGVLPLLGKLRRAGIMTAVVSNKADYGVQSLCHQFFDGLMDCAVGARPGIAKKPAPDAVQTVLSALHIAADEAVYIGDSEVDIETARNAGMPHIIVDWGFRDRSFLIERGAVRIVSTPQALAELLMG